MYAYNAYASIAYLVDGQYERAIECALRCLTGEPDLHGGYRQLVIALVLAGRENEAQACGAAAIRARAGADRNGVPAALPGSASPHVRPLLRCPG